MSEPQHISQTGEPMTDAQAREWFHAQATRAAGLGAVFHRFSVHPEIEHLRLYEGWNERPDDQGEQRWMFAAEANT